MNILVAEKDSSLRMLIATRLSARHYKVIETEKSEDVLRILDKESIDLILLSTEMERTGGRLLIEKIRQKPQFMRVPIILLTEEHDISELIMSNERGFDDFLMKPFSPFVLQLRVAINISRTRNQVEANALTHLPGNFSIERTIRTKIELKEKFSVLYLDINHFKSFNDCYGFDRGDDVLRQTAKILMSTSEEVGPSGECFIGHIGGDDFIVVLPPEKEEAFARKFIAEFDRIIPTYYNDADQKRGHIRTKSRQGKQASFPLMSCSVAACNNLYREYKNLGEVAQDAAEVKAFLKMQPGSHYLRDRRSAPSAVNAQEAMQILGPELKEREKETGDMDPLGKILLNAGLITHKQLSLALKKHLETGQRLGQVLIGMNAIKSEDVGRMLEKKLNVPYVSLRHFIPSREMLRLFTMEFVKSHRVVPLEIAGPAIRLGMCDPFDIKTLDSIERITGFKPVPNLALEDEFENFLERFSEETWREPKAL